MKTFIITAIASLALLTVGCTEKVQLKKAPNQEPSFQKES
jgi:PBP1b-binding outer membrane lipoprotein LpoB